MEYVYAALLVHKAGHPVTEDSVKKVLQAAGVKVEEGRVKALVAALEGVNIDQAIKEVAVPMSATPVAQATAQPAKKEEKKEEKKAEEQAAAGLGALFG